MVMLALWLVGGIIALCGALCYGELGAAFPHAGGEYNLLSRLYHPMAGFLSGWVSFVVGFSAPIAVSAIGFSEYVFRSLPHITVISDQSTVLPVEWIKRLVSIGVIAFFTMVHMRGVKFGTRIQNGLTLLKVLLIVGLITAGFTVGRGDWNHLTQGKTFLFNFGGWKTLGLSLMWIMFAYSGWNASIYIGSEIKEPRRNLPLSLLLGTGLVMVLYLLLNLFYVYASPPLSMEGVISVGGLAVERAFGRTLEFSLSLLIAFAFFSSLSAFIILGPRVYYAMARDGVFFKNIADVHPKYQVPVKAILLQGFIAVCMVLTGSFDQILTYMGFSLGIFPLLAVLGVYKLRRTGKTILKMPGYPWVPLIYLLSGSIILILAFFERRLESSIALGTVLVGVPFYYLFRLGNKTEGNDSGSGF